MPTSPPASTSTATIASARSLPPRVRRVLEAFYTQAANDLSERIGQMLVEVEQQLFKQAEKAYSNEKQAEQFANLHALRNRRSDLLPLYLAGLEAEIASIRLPRDPKADSTPSRIQYQTLTLVEDAEMDQDIVLREIARRHETRAHTPLYLMGQRFGVLAGTPAFDVMQLPVGPESLCRILRTAVAAAYDLNLESQLLLYKSFDRKVLAEYGSWIEVLNTVLSREGVLPGLIYAPQRARGEPRSPAARGVMPGAIDPHSDGTRPMTEWYGQSSPSAWSAFGDDPRTTQPGGAAGMGPAAAHGAPGHGPSPGAAPAPEQEANSFARLQQLLQGQRFANSPAGMASPAAGLASARGAAPQGLGPGGGIAAPLSASSHGPVVPLPTHDVLSSLRKLQSAPVSVVPGQPRRTMRDVQQAMLDQVREEHGPQAGLIQEDADTFELLGMLYGEMEREVQREAPAVEMLIRLQVPVAQAALHDREFFLRPQHPARELLNSVAESGASWLGEDDTDPQLVLKLHNAVERVVTEYDGDEEVFENVNNEVQAHFRAMARKAELVERRHVEAARGKDRLEVAKRRASDTIENALQGHVPQKFVQALLDQAWADVLTLTLLRNGEDSDEWREQEAVTRRIVASTSNEGDPESGDDTAAAPDEALTSQVENALVQVGYHGDEASAIARRLSGTDDEDDATSRTELTARLKARARVGEQAEPRKKPATERTPREQECHDYLRTLPFGTWFEFTRNQQGDVTRQRLSWYSPITDNALFVNQRGQRIGEQSMDSLARLMARDQVHVVTQNKGRLIDRAWKATVKALRNMTGSAVPQGDVA